MPTRSLCPVSILQARTIKFTLSRHIYWGIFTGEYLEVSLKVYFYTYRKSQVVHAIECQLTYDLFQIRKYHKSFFLALLCVFSRKRGLYTLQGDFTLYSTDLICLLVFSRIQFNTTLLSTVVDLNTSSQNTFRHETININEMDTNISY